MLQEEDLALQQQEKTLEDVQASNSKKQPFTHLFTATIQLLAMQLEFAVTISAY